MLENQNENRYEDMVLNINGNNASYYTTPESTTWAQNASQAETSATNQFVRIPIRIISPRQNTHNSQPSQIHLHIVKELLPFHLVQRRK